MTAHDRYLDPHDPQHGTPDACDCCDAPDPVETITEPNGAVVNVCRECHDEYLAATAGMSRCADCGAMGEMTGHMTCQYPQDRR